jgi:hypothetical protein
MNKGVETMKKQKWLDDDGYKERLAQFMQEINPKPDREILERILNKIQAEQVKNSVRL